MKKYLEPLLLIVPFILWFFCFRPFFSGHLYLQADAISYGEHIGFYTDQLSRGVYPLWDPTWCQGAPNDFFLRRIGDVNPLLFLIVFLKWLGVTSAVSYLFFLGVYYFLAGWAFYLITRLLLSDRFFAFIAYILFLFSSWGSEIFYNYIIIIYLPLVWFFYFLLSFSRKPGRGPFLGMFFCAGLVVTTYIPFFFLTVLAIFTILYILFYGEFFIQFLKRGSVFLEKNMVLAGFCAIFLLGSCVPALVFYKESKSGEFVLPNRHLGSDSASAITVGMDNVASGDIINHGYFDRIFDDHAHMDMGDIYMPYVFFLILLSTALAGSNRLIYFLLFNILGLSLITVTTAGGVHRFLYEHVIFFKFIRNIYYFFWLAIFPMLILLSVTAFKSLLDTINGSKRKKLWLAYVLVSHLIFIVFLFGRHGVLPGAWAAIILSLTYFLVYFFARESISYPLGFVLLLSAVFLQSAQVYGFLEGKLYKSQQSEAHYIQTHKDPVLQRMNIYYASAWFSALVEYIDPQVLEDYCKHRFILYDNVLPYKDSPEFFKSLQSTMADNTNIAFLSRFESGPGDWKRDEGSGLHADLEPDSLGELTVLRSDVNSVKLAMHLTKSRFLVVNDNYNSDWHAFINGRPARLLRANFSFKGLWVPAGESSIMLSFSSPRGYLFHGMLTAVYAGVFLCMLFLLRKARKQ